MSEIKSFPFPVISPYSIDYKECSYEAEVSKLPESNKVIVRHNFSGGLIETLIKNKRAVYACVVSLPATMYRKVFTYESSETDCKQEIDYRDSGYGQADFSVESPLFRPIIIATEEIRESVIDLHRLSDVWQGTKIFIPGGSIIAFSYWERLGGNEGSLLIIERDENLLGGEFYVKEEADNGFRFRVYVGKNLYNDIQTPPRGCSEQRISVLTHALSAGLSILKEKYSDNSDWQEHINLRLLSDRLREKGLKNWEEDSDFQPELAATSLYPHIFPDSIAEDMEEDDA